MVNDWSIALRNAHSVDVVYFDISQAFDTVSHHKIKQKLLACGFEGKVLSLISDFITGRSQRVVLLNGFSQWSNLSSGVIFPVEFPKVASWGPCCSFCT